MHAPRRDGALRRSGIELKGARAVVLGRSDIVGKPMAMLLLHEHATVTICHSRTKDLPAVVREADLVVVAIGRTAFVQPDWISREQRSSTSAPTG